MFDTLLVPTDGSETADAAVQYAEELATRYGATVHVLSVVDAHDIDLVVMGTHGRSGLERYLLGSVTEKTVRTSSVPVMTVRQPA